MPVAEPPIHAKILVVDDHAENVDILVRRLRNAGYEPAGAPDGPSALAILEAEAFDLVLLDIMMPMMDGFQVLQRIREKRGPGELPVLMVTARDDHEDVVRGLELGANDYVTKPVEMRVLLARIRTQLRLKRAEDTIRRLAFEDALTGLPNRRLFQDRLERAVGQARRTGGKLAVFYLDLDRFKSINDGLGHEAGDLAIAEFGRRIAEAVRASDTVARLGGDEFVVMLLDAGAEEATQVAEKVRQAACAPFAIDEAPVGLSTSIGVSVFPTHAQDAAGLVKAADAAMYVAKQSRDAWHLAAPEQHYAGA